MNTRCEEYRSELTSFIGRQRAEDEWASLKAHLTRCTGCAAECAALARMWNRLSQWPEEDMPPAPLGAVMAAIQEASGARGAHGWWRGIADGTLSVILLLGLGKLVPLYTICSTCHEILERTPLQQFGFLDEFVGGCFLAAPSVLVATLLARLAGPVDQPGRGTATAAVVSALAGAGLPLVSYVVGSVQSLIAWGIGCTLGAAIGASVGRIPSHRSRLGVGFEARG